MKAGWGVLDDRDARVAEATDPDLGYAESYAVLLRNDFQLSVVRSHGALHTFLCYTNHTIYAVWDSDRRNWRFMLGDSDAPLMDSAAALLTWMRVEGLIR